MAVSEALAHYYQQFIGLRETGNSTDSSQKAQVATDIISAIYMAHTKKKPWAIAENDSASRASSPYP